MCNIPVVGGGEERFFFLIFIFLFSWSLWKIDLTEIVKLNNYVGLSSL